MNSAQYGESVISTFVQHRMHHAEELLESGIYNGNMQWILEAKNSFLQLKDIVPQLKSKVMRALTALSIVDQKNALHYLEEGFRLDNKDPAILNNIAYILHKQQGNFEAAIRFYQDCLAADSKFEVAYLGISDIYRSLRLFKLEKEYLKRAVENCPKSPDLWNSLGMNCLTSASYRRLDTPLSCFERALTLNPNVDSRAMIKVNMGALAAVQGNVDEALSHYANAIKLSPRVESAYHNALLILHCFTSVTPSIRYLFDALNLETSESGPFAANVDRAHVAAATVLYPPTQNSPPERQTSNWNLRVGYVSSDFFEHVVSRFFQVILNHGKYDLFLYSNIVYDPMAINKIKCKGYRCIKDLSAQDVAAMVGSDEIDILVDLSGYTQGNRIDVFRLRPAPVLLTYCGYPNSLGLPYIKRITDEYTDRYSGQESVVKLSRPFLCYTPDTVCTAFKSFDKYDPAKVVTAGCFARLQKINQRVINVWLRLLAEVPQLRIVIKSRLFVNPELREKWQHRFLPFSGRVVLLKGADSQEEHMALYRLLDLHLDTFPYSGTTITAESLLMNVPVVTLSPVQEGTPHVSRVSGSILSSLGLESLCVAVDEDEYIVKIKRVIPVLAHLHVRKRILSSTFLDTADFIKHYENALLDSWVSCK